MKYWADYVFIALGAICSIFSFYWLFRSDNSGSNIAGIIVGIALVKITLEKLKLRKEKELNQDRDK
ncbi:hypothetical protein [uncultured Nonlabens sp.]|uniref:hypothetical protein n=1 Tax=uncultured Nonlabens sp. TaxID=859306 RepID=UPI002635F555|nr:hypothetical protein [uncultured Nonlabens sp.]